MPDCTKGTVYNMAQPGAVIRIDYLTELPRHAEALRSTASMRMPWNYRETRKQTATPPALVRRSAHGKPDRPLPSTPYLPRRPRFCTPAEETQCEYDLTGNMSDVCPECGAAVACAAYR